MTTATTGRHQVIMPGDGHGQWLADGSPGTYGDPEVWLDAGERHLRAGDVLQQGGTAYLVITRRHSQANSGRPFYVLRKVPDSAPWGNEEGRLMTDQEQEPPAERRGGRKVDWANVKPGQDVPELPGQEPLPGVDEYFEDPDTGRSGR